MLTQKPYTWIELNHSAFAHNVQWYKTHIGSHKNLAAVIKSNGYGHGLLEMGSLCQASSFVDWICTATLSEAITLRMHNVTKPILVLSIIDEDPALAAQHGITLPVIDLPTAHAINEAGKKINKIISVHIKVDTGMSRFGFMPHEALKTTVEMQKLPFIFVQGIFTSCAQAGTVDQEFTLHQLTQFDTLCAQLEERGIHIPLRHATNSAATANFFPQFPRFNFVRIGAGIYGLDHMAQAQPLLQQAITWKTRVTSIKEIPAGAYVGYDRTFQATRNTTLAIIPIGYQEGYDRRMSNKGVVLINTNYYAHVVGRICMNATIIAIPENQHVSLGDEVVVLGDKPQLHAQEIAQLIGSFNAREITTRINPAIERRVVNNQLATVNHKQHTAQREAPCI